MRRRKEQKNKEKTHNSTRFVYLLFWMYVRRGSAGVGGEMLVAQRFNPVTIITPITKRQCHHPGNRPMCGAVMQDVGSAAEGQSSRRLRTSFSYSMSICPSTFPLKNFTYPVAQASRHGTGLGERKAEGSTLGQLHPTTTPPRGSLRSRG